MEKMNDLSDLLKHEILDLYSAENQILAALPLMIGRVSNKELKSALERHLKVTEAQVRRLEGTFSQLGIEESGGKTRKKGLLSGLFGGSKDVCVGMKGIIEEGNKVISENMAPEVLDAAIIACAQKVEHYEICGYGTARSYARELGLEDLALVLEQTLDEEYEADDLLTTLAVSRVNKQAEKPQRGGARPKERTTRSEGAPARERSARREPVLEPVLSADRITQNDIGTTEDDTRSGKSRGSGSPRKEGGARNTASASRTAGARKSTGGASSSGKAIRGTGGATEGRTGSASSGRQRK